jgi:hypothetical protein
VFGTPDYKSDANQNYTKISSHFSYSRVITTTNAGKDEVKQEPLYNVSGNANFTTIMESGMEIPQKGKDITVI